MQKLTRYYITNSGEEPTVRSVKVALGVDEPDERSNPQPAPAGEAATTREKPDQPGGVRVGRLVKNAMRRRSTKP